MNENQHYYQAMFLLDNQEVRQKGFNAVRDWVRKTLEKHGIRVHVLRLWAERELAYPIGNRRRATYLLGWLEAGGTSVNEAKREMYLLGPVFRSQYLEEACIPEDEMALGIAEIGDHEVVIPDDVVVDESDENSVPEPEPDVDEEETVGIGRENDRG